MRPKLCRTMNADDFRENYWLKEELVDFCKVNNIMHSGGKADLTERIVYYLKGETLAIRKTEKENRDRKTIPKRTGPLSIESTIANDYKNDEEHRTFFQKVIGPHFKFNVSFMDWMKANSGKTYKDAVNEWKKISDAKKSGEKSEIAPQFEYNQYTRNFFQANPDRTREDMIDCWNHKKSQPGSHKYEDCDLEILD